MQFIVQPTHVWQLPLEQLSGSQLAWSFLGYSGWFQVLLGVLELVPALLLLFRRTTLLGAILLLPLTLNVVLVNQAFHLWPDTQLVSLVLLLLNVGLLAFEWRNISSILRIIWQRERRYQLGVWEVGINVLLVATLVGVLGSTLLDYARDTNELTGDWPHQHPKVWVWQPGPAAPSAAAGTHKSYFGDSNSYEEVSPAGLNQHLHWYKLDKQRHQLLLGPRPDSVAQAYTYSLAGDSVLTLRPIGITGNSLPAVQVWKQHVINAGTR